MLKENIVPVMQQNVGCLPRTLFLGDLPLLCNEEMIFNLFSRYGRIESLHLKREDSEKNQHRNPRLPQNTFEQHYSPVSYGFIKFEVHECAMAALQELNGAFVLGRRLRVSWAHDTPGVSITPDPFLSKSKKTAQIHVLYATPVLNETISELHLYEVFSRYGKVVDVSIKKSVFNQEKKIQSGYGFVHFTLSEEGIESALRAVQETNQQTINYISFEVTLTHGLRTLLMHYKSRPPQLPFLDDVNAHLSANRSNSFSSANGYFSMHSSPSNSCARSLDSVSFVPSVSGSNSTAMWNESTSSSSLSTSTFSNHLSFTTYR